VQPAAGLLGSVLSIVAYGLVIWAQPRSTLAAVAALRKTSVVVAAGTGAVSLGERFGRLRVLAATLVCCARSGFGLCGRRTAERTQPARYPGTAIDRPGPVQGARAGDAIGRVPRRGEPGDGCGV